ncbi:YceD family protein [Cohnella faecalis]|nr:DUF177 domain-containing protein [Cohnella faecalis]
MLINVQELLSRQQPIEREGTFELKDLFRDSRDTTPLGPLSFRLTANAAGERRIGVTGELTADLRLLCSRCLDPIDHHFEVEFEEMFQVMKDTDPEPGEDDDFIPVYGERLELRPFLEEELVLNLPLAPLCREDCKGLCSECGTSLNEKTCGCGTEKIDPRLAALQDWFKPE